MFRFFLVGALVLSSAASAAVAQGTRQQVPASASTAGAAEPMADMPSMSMPKGHYQTPRSAGGVGAKAATPPADPVGAASEADARSAGVQISGVVSLKAESGQELEKGEQADTLVYFVPTKNAGSQPKPGLYTVYTHNREFSPEAIAVPLGSKVTYVNLDDVRHNVFSVTPGATFNLGYQSAGDKAAQTYTQPGLILIGCKVHRSMELDLLVVPSRYATQVSADGKFVLRGLPPGPGTLTFWNPRGELVTQKITLPMTASVRQDIAVTRERMVTQINTGERP